MPAHVSVIIIFLNAERFIQEAIESVPCRPTSRGSCCWWMTAHATRAHASRRVRRGAPGADPVSGAHRACQPRHERITESLASVPATGAYIAFLDSDDVWHPNKLERQVALLGAHPDAGMVYGRTEYWHSWTGNPDDAALDHVADLGVPRQLVPASRAGEAHHPFGRAPRRASRT